MKREREERGSDGLEDAPKPSDQLPEEAPGEQVPTDVPGDGEGAAREAGRRHAHRAGGDRQAPGKPPGAGGRPR
jgi:hypothetical protein